MDGSRVFHSIRVNCLTDKDILVFRIILKQDLISKVKIGDILLGKVSKPDKFNNSWKFSS